ncbi:hypothetical protein V3G39_11430 [Dermatophilaceae bacterium Sec6.4]
MDAAAVTFLIAAALHAGFQLTVTVLVYPALSRIPPERWPDAHARHSRGIVPLVGVVYVLLAVSVCWMLLADRSGWTYAGAVLAAAVASVTAFGAAPIHGRLSERDDALVRRLLQIDTVRAVLAVLLLGVALGAAAQ